MLKRINYKDQIISRTHVRNNILRVWNSTTPEDRHDWYAGAHAFAEDMSEESGITIAQACGILSALSPLTSWKKNKEYAVMILGGIKAEDMPTLKTSARKAYTIMHARPDEYGICRILNGLKTQAFFMNILHPDEKSSLTIDRHAISIALGSRKSSEEISITPKQYQFFEDCYRWTADYLKVSPLLLQSATWVRWRKIK